MGRTNIQRASSCRNLHTNRETVEPDSSAAERAKCGSPKIEKGNVQPGVAADDRCPRRYCHSGGTGLESSSDSQIDSKCEVIRSNISPLPIRKVGVFRLCSPMKYGPQKTSSSTLKTFIEGRHR